MVCILGEMIQESGVKHAKEISCQMQGMAKRNLICSVMKHRPTGFVVKQNSVRKFTIASTNQTRRTRSACSMCLPRIATPSNVSSEFAVLKTAANIKSAALKTAVNNNNINIHSTFKNGT